MRSPLALVSAVCLACLPACEQQQNLGSNPLTDATYPDLSDLARPPDLSSSRDFSYPDLPPFDLLPSVICPGPQTLCNGRCVDLQADHDDCGACGKTCSATEYCLAAACAPCPVNYAACASENTCINYQIDNFNCGGCGKACAQNATCVSGNCVVCAGIICRGLCINQNDSRTDCGACGHACGANQFCRGAQCVSCPPLAPTLCNNACVDLNTDVVNCGKCNLMCGGACVNGKCM